MKSNNFLFICLLSLALWIQSEISAVLKSFFLYFLLYLLSLYGATLLMESMLELILNVSWLCFKSTEDFNLNFGHIPKDLYISHFYEVLYDASNSNTSKRPNKMEKLPVITSGMSTIKNCIHHTYHLWKFGKYTTIQTWMVVNNVWK